MIKNKKWIFYYHKNERGKDLPHTLLLPANQKAVGHTVTKTALQTGKTEQTKLAKENIQKGNPNKQELDVLCSLLIWSPKLTSTTMSAGKWLNLILFKFNIKVP